MRIGIIDDNIQMLSFIKDVLTKENYQVYCANNGIVGLMLFEETAPDLVITDIVMPEGEGIETIIKLKENYPELPIIAISGYGEAYLNAAKKLGASEVMAKPFSHIELINIVNKALGSQSSN